jgi:hypothetical protein
MTIRMLEDGDYRLQEQILDRIHCRRMTEQSARVLENGELRSHEDHATRTMQDAQRQGSSFFECCPPVIQDCNLRACGLSVDSYMVGSSVYVAFSCAMCCGNYAGTSTCAPYWSAEISTGALVIWGPSACQQVVIPGSTGLPCGVIFKAYGGLGPSQVTLTKGEEYWLRVYLWNGKACPGFPTNLLPDVWTGIWFTAGGR